MNQIFFELDFLPVGSSERSGDAICLRQGIKDENRVLSQEILVIDGGTKESGEKVVEHIRKYYNSNSVTHLLNTHPDIDHASGLSVVMENLTIGRLWLHQPWNYADQLKDKFKDVRWTTEGLEKKLKESYPFAYSLEEIAKSNNVPISQPFQGSRIGPFVVLSPTESWYLDLVPEFDNTPEARQKTRSTKFRSLIETIKNWIDENWDFETLSEDGVTSASNESSVVLYGKIDNVGLLMTADAGIDALNAAADYSITIGQDLTSTKFIQIPHHGSRNNVNPSTLDRIVGTKVGLNSEKTKSAYVSVSQNSETHPRKVVTNAFLRRGANVFCTNGSIIYYYHNMNLREGWTGVQPLPFYNQVEE